VKKIVTVELYVEKSDLVAHGMLEEIDDADSVMNAVIADEFRLLLNQHGIFHEVEHIKVESQPPTDEVTNEMPKSENYIPNSNNLINEDFIKLSEMTRGNQIIVYNVTKKNGEIIVYGRNNCGEDARNHRVVVKPVLEVIK
jgi:hypothetical protein